MVAIVHDNLLLDRRSRVFTERERIKGEGEHGAAVDLGLRAILHGKVACLDCTLVPIHHGSELTVIKCKLGTCNDISTGTLKESDSNVSGIGYGLIKAKVDHLGTIRIICPSVIYLEIALLVAVFKKLIFIVRGVHGKVFDVAIRVFALFAPGIAHGLERGVFTGLATIDGHVNRKLVNSALNILITIGRMEMRLEIAVDERIDAAAIGGMNGGRLDRPLLRVLLANNERLAGLVLDVDLGNIHSLVLIILIGVVGSSCLQANLVSRDSAIKRHGLCAVAIGVLPAAFFCLDPLGAVPIFNDIAVDATRTTVVGIAIKTRNVLDGFDRFLGA